MTESPLFSAAVLTSMGSQALTVAVLRYVLLAVPAFALGYVLLRRLLLPRRIQPGSPTTAQVARELTLSITSSAVFAAIDVVVVVLSVKGVMKLGVFDPTPSFVPLAGSVLLLVLVHDAYFYWAHRFLHWGPVFRLAHYAHHRSIRPTPLAAFAFHPLEAVVQYGFVPLIALVAPVHVTALFIFGIIMTAMNVYGHGGIELSPHRFVRSSIGRFLLTPTHHDLHHSTVTHNYGFYTNVWDRLMGTNYPDYEETFERVTSGAGRLATPPTATRTAP